MATNRVRSRFRRGGIVRDSKDNNSESAEAEETLLNWWELRSKAVLKWIDDNPLLLGIDHDSATLIKDQLAKGSIAGTPDVTRRKIWAHAYVELASVPGLPSGLVSSCARLLSTCRAYESSKACKVTLVTNPRRGRRKGRTLEHGGG